MVISIHAPHTGRDASAARPRYKYGIISIHAPHTGRDLFLIGLKYLIVLFQSTRPIRGATLEVYFYQSLFYHFNPRAPYGARHNRLSDNMLCNNISIHAPHTGRDYDMNKNTMKAIQFQSTRPIRGATKKKTAQ